MPVAVVLPDVHLATSLMDPIGLLTSTWIHHLLIYRQMHFRAFGLPMLQVFYVHATYDMSVRHGRGISPLTLPEVSNMFPHIL